MFIDATYEGDLMAKAGVTYTSAAKDNAVYGETLNGVQKLRLRTALTPSLDRSIPMSCPAIGRAA